MSASDSRGAHREEEHEEHENHEAWVIPYADMLTLLMCLFLVLFAVVFLLGLGQALSIAAQSALVG